MPESTFNAPSTTTELRHKTPSGPRDHLRLLGSSLEMQRDPLRFLLAMKHQYGDIVTIAQRYQLRLVPGHPAEPEALLTLRPRYGLPMTLHEI